MGGDPFNCIFYFNSNFFQFALLLRSRFLLKFCILSDSNFSELFTEINKSKRVADMVLKPVEANNTTPCDSSNSIDIVIHSYGEEIYQICDLLAAAIYPAADVNNLFCYENINDCDPYFANCVTTSDKKEILAYLTEGKYITGLLLAYTSCDKRMPEMPDTPEGKEFADLLHASRGVTYVEFLEALPDLWHSQVGRVLFTELEIRARAQNNNMLFVATDNERSKLFYTKCGLTQYKSVYMYKILH